MASAPTAAEIHSAAMMQHRAGQLKLAEDGYRRVLEIDPKRAEAWHMWGILAQQIGRHDLAVERIQKAVAERPNEATFRVNLGSALKSLGRNAEAALSFESAIALAPQMAEAHNNLGATYRSLGRLDDAAVCYRRAVQIRPNYAEAHCNLGNTLRDQNRLDEAVASYQTALQLKSDYAEANLFLGQTLQQMRRGEALVSLRRAVELQPQSALAHCALGAALLDAGQTIEALTSIQQAFELAPNDPEVLNNLGYLLTQLKRYDEAIALLRKALQLDAGSASIHGNLGVALKEQNHLDEAVTSLREAVRLAPNDARARSNLGSVLKEQGCFDEAASQLQQAVQLDPNYPEAYYNLALVLTRMGKPADAQACHQRAIQIRPDYAEAHNSLGASYAAQWRYDDAMACYRRALQYKPGLASAHNNLGNLYSDKEMVKEAVECYEKALRLDPDYGNAHYNLATSLLTLGQTDAAAEHYRQCVRIKPTSRVQLVSATLLPMVYSTLDDMFARRAALIDNLARLREGGVRMDLNVEFGHYPFFLAYQGCNDRDVMVELAGLHTPATVPPRDALPSSIDNFDRRPRIGFISRCFRHHTVGELMRGIIAHLSRDLFHVTVFSIGGHNDQTHDLIRKSADRFVEVSGSVIPGRRAVASAPVDVLFYTDIGMDAVTYSLAFSRLAPVQCTTWGHPCTTGITAMDYYLSSELFEAEEGDEHYSENLVRLKSIPAFCYRPELPAKMKSRSEFGFSDSQHIYACPQSLFKLRPDFDLLVAGILRRDPQGQVIFVDGHQPYWKELLRERFRATIPDVADRIQFLPRMSHDDFLALNACCDVLIDPIHFNGGNTSYKALALGTPIVTLPMRLLRGRMTYALYKKMNLMDCVASTPEEYVEIAVRLATDREYREMIRGRILAANHVLYEDHSVVRELEQFFLQSLAKRGN